MSKLVILAGPQAAGKSTIGNTLCAQLHNLSALFQEGRASLFFPMQESRQIIVHRHLLLGAIFMTPEQELEVIQCDFERMDLIWRRNQKALVYVDECTVFTLAHAAAHDVVEVERYWAEYLNKLERLNAVIVFVDVPPETSWDRRRRRYAERLIYFNQSEHEAVLKRYRDYLFRLHPLLHDVYRRLPFPKVLVDGCSSPDNVLKKVCQELARLMA